MEQIMSGLLQDSEVMTALKDRYIISLPNSGYPERIRNHITFAKHPEYFVDKLDELVNKGADIVGGCCGTTPDFIRLLTEKTDTVQKGRTDFTSSSEAEEVKPVNETGEIVLNKVVVPEYIVVHDGPINDSSAENYYVRYRDYIKNVASSEIYATWPDDTIRANILAIMSFTLNRVYTEWCRNVH